MTLRPFFKRRRTLLVALFTVASEAVFGATFKAAQMDSFMAALESAPLSPPSYSLMIASGGQTLYSRQAGTTQHGGSEPVSADTAFYVASVSKSFMGLLAAKLDANGMLPLSMTLAEAWPALRLPKGLDAQSITLRDLLAHTHGIKNDPLTILSAYVGATPVADYQRILERFSTAAPRTVRYDNTGFLIYAAVLEAKTGKGWQDWLDDEIHRPLGLSSATTRTSDMESSGMGLGAHFDGSRKAHWTVAPAKADDQMHPAGGHFISSADAVRWLQAHLKHQRFSDEIYATAHAAVADRTPAKKYEDMTCTAYTLGWQTCHYEGRRVLYAGGTFDGMMIFMAVLPDDDLTVVSINGARAFGWTFGWHSLQQAFDFALGLPGAEENAARRLKGQSEDQLDYALYRARIREAAFRQANQPGTARLRDGLIGSYRSEAYGVASVCPMGDKLVFAVGRYRAEILPTGPAEVSFLERAFGGPIRAAVHMTAGGDTLSFEWEGGRFDHTGENPCVGKDQAAR